MSEREPVLTNPDEFRERLIKKCGKSLSPDDPIWSLFEVLAEIHRDFLKEVKNSNMVAVADALLSQQRFLKLYQKNMEAELGRETERVGEIFKEKLKAVGDEGLKRNEAVIRDGMNAVFGMYKMHLKTLKICMNALILLIILAAVGVGCLYAILIKVCLVA